jgi:PGF-pre-PGF domain-containing protein
VWQSKKIKLILFTTILAVQVIAGSAAATTFYVDDDGSGDFSTIQAAVNNSTAGDTIIVKPGIYSGNIEVDVGSLTITSDSADSGETTIEVANSSIGFNLQPSAIGTTIKGFTIKGSGKGYGILFDSASSCIIQNNKFSYLSSGVDISLWIGGNHSILKNKFSNCDTGISIFESMDNKVKGNNISNCNIGIQIRSNSPDNLITGNNVSNCSKGMWLEDSRDNRIYNNYFSNIVNLKLIEPDECIWNTTKTEGKNIIGGPYIGGNFWGTPSGGGFSQTHLDADGDGIAEESYSINERNVDYMPLVTPRTNSTPSLPAVNLKTNTTTGSASLAVQFADTSRNATERSWDFENDGIIDSTDKNEVHVYTVPGNYTVNLTAENENGTASKLIHITVTKAVENNSKNTVIENNGTNENSGNNSKDTTSGNSTNSTAGNVSIGDNEHSGDSGSSSEGSSHSSSGGNSHSSSGGGGSPEPQSNVEVKELSQAFVTSGNTIRFDFSKNVTCVLCISFDSKKTFGKTTTIVEMLKGKSSLVSDLPEGEVYKSFNVWVGNGGTSSSKNIENPAICFKVEKSWLKNENIDPASITLNWYNEKKWEQFPVKVSWEDANYLYFTANVSGYSSFVITGKVKSTSGQQEASALQKAAELQAKELSSVGSVSLTDDPNDTVITGGTKKSASGFEMLFGIVGMLAVFLYRRK